MVFVNVLEVPVTPYILTYNVTCENEAKSDVTDIGVLGNQISTKRLP